MGNELPKPGPSVKKNFFGQYSIFRTIPPFLLDPEDTKAKLSEAKYDRQKNAFKCRLNMQKLVYEGQMQKQESEDNQEPLLIIQGHGRLHMKHNSRVFMEGNFKNGLLEGEGVFISPQFEYRGQFKNGNYEGIGFYKMNSPRQMYRGEFMAGLRHGKGVYKSEEVIIKSFWQEDELEGVIRVSNRDNDLSYEGQIKKNRLQGYGKKEIIGKSAQIYQGFFKNNEQDGFGVLEDGAKYIFVGFWKEGEREGEGIQIKNGKISSRGIYKNNNKLDIEQPQISFENRLFELIKEPYKHSLQQNPLKKCEQLEELEEDFDEEIADNDQKKTRANQLQLLIRY